MHPPDTGEKERIQRILLMLKYYRKKVQFGVSSRSRKSQQKKKLF